MTKKKYKDMTDEEKAVRKARMRQKVKDRLGYGVNLLKPAKKRLYRPTEEGEQLC